MACVMGVDMRVSQKGTAFIVIFLIYMLQVLYVAYYGADWIGGLAGRDITGPEGLFYAWTFSLLACFNMLFYFFVRVLIGAKLYSSIYKLFLALGGTFIMAVVILSHKVAIILGAPLADPFIIESILSRDVFDQVHLQMTHIVTIGLLMVLFGGGLYAFSKILESKFKYPLISLESRLRSLAWIFALITCASVAWSRSKVLEYRQEGASIVLSLPAYRVLFKGSAAKGIFRGSQVTYQAAIEHNYSTPQKTPHLLMLLIETFRADAFGPELTPNMFRFSKENRCVTSDFHTPTSHVSEEGAFSMIYGLNAYNYFGLRRNHSPSYPVQLLKSYGYHFSGFSGSALRGRRGADIIVDNFDTYWEASNELRLRDRDEALIKKLKEFWSKRTAGPQAQFAFLTSTHHNYDFSDAFAIDQPILPYDYNSLGSLLSYKSELRNRYRNSVRYVDHLFQKIIEIYQEEIASGDVVIALAGDHGEEFWDEGSLGHAASRLINSRIKVPFFICIPGIQGKRFSLSSQPDIWPTILDYMGIRAEDDGPWPYDGISLISDKEHRYIVNSAASFPEESSKLRLLLRIESIFLVMFQKNGVSFNLLKREQRTTKWL
ncbi:MAG: sulfatase-like hydrolase/transferase [Bdellovibrionota bacterium]